MMALFFPSGENGTVELEVLYIDDCPNWEEAGSRLRDALQISGHDSTRIRYRVLRTAADVEGTAFAGSPTITLDGIDLFPSAGATSDLACRIYQTPTGLAGLPTTEQLVGRIKDHG
jgi:hypothetical protein